MDMTLCACRIPCGVPKSLNPATYDGLNCSPIVRGHCGPYLHKQTNFTTFRIDITKRSRVSGRPDVCNMWHKWDASSWVTILVSLTIIESFQHFLDDKHQPTNIRLKITQSSSYSPSRGCLTMRDLVGLPVIILPGVYIKDRESPYDMATTKQVVQQRWHGQNRRTLRNMLYVRRCTSCMVEIMLVFASFLPPPSRGRFSTFDSCKWKLCDTLVPWPR